MDDVELFLSSIKDKMKDAPACIIYGAGNTAEAVYRALQMNDVKVRFFCVSDKSQNKNDIMGVPIVQIDEIKDEKAELLMVVAVKEQFLGEVEKTLEYNGWTDYLVTPTGILKRHDRQVDRYVRPTLEITPKIGCGVQCRYCPQSLLYKRYFSKDKNRVSKMTLEDFKLYIDKTPKHVILEFAGFVEPYLHEEATEMILYANSLGRDITLFTTLVGMTKDDFYKIKDVPFYEVVLHLPDKDGFAKIPITVEYLELLDLMIDARKSDGTPFIYIANCQSEPDESILERIAGKVRVISDLVDRAGNLEGTDLRSNQVREGAISCNKTSRLDHNILLPDGSVVLCCMDFGLEHVLGNLKQQTYEEIQEGAEKLRIRGLMEQASGCGDLLCRNCTNAVLSGAK